MPDKPSYEELEKTIKELKDVELERQKIEEMLRDEVSRWKLLIGHSKDGIVILEQNGSVYDTNKQYADMLGYSVDEVLKLHVWDWDAVISKEQLLEYMQIIDETGVYFETKHRRKDGSLIDVEISISSSIYHGKKLILCVHRDRTEQKRAEQERTALIEQLKKAIDEIKTLQGILPICSHCKKICDDNGTWKSLEDYLDEHSDAKLSHGLCQECAKKHYPDVF